MATVERAITCPNSECGAEISADVMKCPACGTDLNLAMIARATEEIKKNPTEAQNYFARGYAYAANGDHERALADLDYAIKLDPNLAGAYQIRGMKRLEMGDHRAAIFDFNHAIKLNSDDKESLAESLFYRGMAYVAEKDTKNAMADFQQVLTINPKHADAYIQRAMLFDDQGNTGGAIAEIKKALENVTDSYERTQLEEMLTKLGEFQSQKRKQQMGAWLHGWRLRLLIALAVFVFGLLTHNEVMFVFALLILGGWSAIRVFLKAIFR